MFTAVGGTFAVMEIVVVVPAATGAKAARNATAQGGEVVEDGEVV
jgi:hypothetical protein